MVLVLTSINLLLIFSAPFRTFPFLLKSVIFFFWQSFFVVLLYGLRFGFLSGALSGLAVAGQLFLAFWPGMIFMRANSQSQITRTLGRWLSSRNAFVVSVCLRFLPRLWAEIGEIREVQILRGARISTKDLKNPRSLEDWLHCLMVPSLIKTLALSAAIALAANARDFALSPKRSFWPGD